MVRVIAIFIVFLSLAVSADQCYSNASVNVVAFDDGIFAFLINESKDSICAEELVDGYNIYFIIESRDAVSNYNPAGSFWHTPSLVSLFSYSAIGYFYKKSYLEENYQLKDGDEIKILYRPSKAINEAQGCSRVVGDSDSLIVTYHSGERDY